MKSLVSYKIDGCLGIILCILQDLCLSKMDGQRVGERCWGYEGFRTMNNRFFPKVVDYVKLEKDFLGCKSYEGLFSNHAPFSTSKQVLAYQWWEIYEVETL